MTGKIEQNVHLVRAGGDLVESQLPQLRGKGFDLGDAELDFRFVRGHQRRDRPNRGSAGDFFYLLASTRTIRWPSANVNTKRPRVLFRHMSSRLRSANGFEAVAPREKARKKNTDLRVADSERAKAPQLNVGSFTRSASGTGSSA